jgi:hypothetical protein
MLEKLKEKFADEIVRYGIKRVKIENGEVRITSSEILPWNLFEAIKSYLA